MKRDDELTRTVSDWLESGTRPLPARVLDDAMSTVARTDQRGPGREWGIRLGQAFAVAGWAALAVAIVLVVPVLLNLPATDPPTGAGSAATNIARIRPTTPLRLTAFLEIQGPTADPEFEGLTRYESSVDRSTGFGPFSISLDPSAAHNGAMPTSDQLVLRFVMGEVDAVFVSSKGECTVTFGLVSANVIDGEFVCRAVPSPDYNGPADVTGTFNFAP